MLDKLKQRIKELLTNKIVNCVIGYEQGDNPTLARPVYITKPNEAERLVYNEYCIPILAKYILKPEVRSLKLEAGKIGIIAKPSDVRALVGLIQEKQIIREDVYIIAVGRKEDFPKIYDEIIETPLSELDAKRKTQDAEQLKQIAEFEKKTPEEKRAFWQREFDKCIKCYACRQICPLCYCRVCIADKNQPQWIPPMPNSGGNFSWNMIRAYHLAGRCIDCGECERACPVDIPLMMLNKKIQQMIKEKFDYQAGLDPEVPPPLSTYQEDDKEKFII
ncbi:MAG: 4Fe-4S dicluster domain-containing protein [Planctomycetes bacterium]|nr:4Fe-4S dicluster domain-containing protein [Planctomycetota bacterium]